MKIYKEIQTNAAIDTEKVGIELAEEMLKDSKMPRFIALEGDLGVGKTVFVRGFVSAIVPGAAVRSPTFALVNEYKCMSGKTVKKVCHFDMYRIVDEDDLYSIGFYDYLRDDILCIAEWCELIPYALPDKYIRVEITKLNLESKRNIAIETIG